MISKVNVLKQVITFLVITSIISIGIFIWMFSGARDSMPAVLAMMWTPGISAILTSLIFKDKIRNYGWKSGKCKFLGYAYILPILVSIVAYGLVWLSGFAEFTTEEVVNYKWAELLGFTLPAPFIAGLLSKMVIVPFIALIFVTGEEIGWSGFLTPKLLKISSVHVTSLIVGIYWSVWHYPGIIGGFYGSGTPLWVQLPGFTLCLIGASFVRTVLVSQSKSLWTGVVLHASHNIVLMGIFYEMTVKQGYSGYLVSETGVFLGIVYIIIAVIFWRIQVRKPSSDMS
ncbi:CPBP family intramembrane glutamic endopeptidase [Bacteroidota bacterium]